MMSDKSMHIDICIDFNLCLARNFNRTLYFTTIVKFQDTIAIQLDWRNVVYHGSQGNCSHVDDNVVSDIITVSFIVVGFGGISTCRHR